MSSPILPGATLGILGSGQLGRMFALSAKRMGYRLAVFSPERDTPTGQVADREVVAPYEDLDAVRAFAASVNVVTFEFENIPATTADAAAEQAIVRPGGHVLHTTQHRLREKTFLREHGFPVAPFTAVRSLAELRVAAEQRLDSSGRFSGAVLKTAGWGYDGKGQFTITSLEQLALAWETVNAAECVLETFVDFDREVSVVAARSDAGAFADWGVIDNTHHNHILDVSVAPSVVSAAIARQAASLARDILQQLNVVGVLTVEFFLTRSGELVVNELAPRPHNSGHLTVDASLTSQFEQQVRAVCDLPLGSTRLLRPVAMANLLGDVWLAGGQRIEPNWAATLAVSPEVKLHLYGKSEPRRGRKMGHLTAMAESGEEARRIVTAARAALTRGSA